MRIKNYFRFSVFCGVCMVAFVLLANGIIYLVQNIKVQAKPVDVGTLSGVDWTYEEWQNYIKN